MVFVEKRGSFSQSLFGDAKIFAESLDERQSPISADAIPADIADDVRNRQSGKDRNQIKSSESKEETAKHAYNRSLNNRDGDDQDVSVSYNVAENYLYGHKLIFILYYSLMTTVSIVIPAYNEEKYIGRLLTSLQKLPKENILEILVVDNGSSDKTKEVVRIASLSVDGSDPKIRLIVETRKGVAWARTRGAGEARGDIIAFLDADTFVTDKWLPRLLKYFSSDKVVSVSGPTYLYDVPSLTRVGVVVYWWFASAILYRIVGYMGIFANLAIRAESFKKIGGIDTSVEFYGDDTNITRRLSKVGKVVFSRSVSVFASGRRLNTEGLLHILWHYPLNFFSEVLVHKPVTKGYTEVR